MGRHLHAVRPHSILTENIWQKSVRTSERTKSSVDQLFNLFVSIPVEQLYTNRKQNRRLKFAKKK